MAIRYTPDYNERIRRIVRNYNQNLIRANKKGKLRKADLPEPVSIKALKRTYNRRKDLERELSNLEAFNRRSASKRVNEYVSEYDINIIKKNRLRAIRFFDQQRKIKARLIQNDYPGTQNEIELINEKLKLLHSDMDFLNTEDLRSLKATVQEYRVSFAHQSAGYRGFLSEVDYIMRNVGIDSNERDAFFNKLKKVSTEEMYYIYQNSDLIKRVYELAGSETTGGGKKGKLKMNASEDDAKELIDALLEDIDNLIINAKNQM